MLTTILISFGVSSPQLAARFALCGWYFDTPLLAAGSFIVKDLIKLINPKDGRIPFDDNTIDIVYSMSVFEHVEDLDSVLKEINRIMKIGGVMKCSFPLKGSLWEGHYNIPFSHWFKKNILRKVWCFIFYKFGFGVNRNQYPTFIAWYNAAFNFIDSYCFYRYYSQFKKLFARNGFIIRSVDKELFFYVKQSDRFFYKVFKVLVVLLPNNLFSYIVRHIFGVTLEVKKMENANCVNIK